MYVCESRQETGGRQVVTELEWMRSFIHWVVRLSSWMGLQLLNTKKCKNVKKTRLVRRVERSEFGPFFFKSMLSATSFPTLSPAVLH